MSAEQRIKQCRAFHAVQAFYLLSHIILSLALLQQEFLKSHFLFPACFIIIECKCLFPSFLIKVCSSIRKGATNEEII